MHRYILTGAPGAGKTVLLRRLEVAGYPVVEEAATALIALVTARGVERHWEQPNFIDDIVALQRARQLRADAYPDAVVFFDRSPICTVALAEFLDRAPSAGLLAEVDRIQSERTYEAKVFFCDLFGFITPTEARRITLEDSQRFEAVHADVYARYGYDLVHLPPADVETRFEAVVRCLLPNDALIPED
jgi:predicted ATPase